MNGSRDHEHVANEQLTTALVEAARTFVQLCAEGWTGYAEAVTASQYDALVVLAEAGPMRLTDFADSLGVDPSTATRLCDRLVRRRYVSRTHSEVSRREVRVELAEHGAELVDAVAESRRSVFAALAASVPASRRAALASALHLLTDKAAVQMAIVPHQDLAPDVANAT